MHHCTVTVVLRAVCRVAVSIACAVSSVYVRVAFLIDSIPIPVPLCLPVHFIRPFFHVCLALLTLRMCALLSVSHSTASRIRGTHTPYAGLDDVVSAMIGVYSAAGVEMKWRKPDERVSPKVRDLNELFADDPVFQAVFAQVRKDRRPAGIVTPGTLKAIKTILKHAFKSDITQ